ncbi:MAG: diguanylate cyclase [Thermodesulfobacteriota bacterium]
MKRIRDTVVNAIYQYADQDDCLIQEINRIVDQTGEKHAYSVLFKILTHLDIAPEIAETCWQQILDHRREMSEKLGRAVNLRTVVCDYFCSIDQSFQNPVVVDIHVFENHLNSMKFDSLTGLYSRTTFDETLKREISRAKRYETELCILFLDIDDFKQINDVFGHLAGDMVLQEIARIIRQEIRTEDTAARYGGEEMVVVLPETGKVEGLILGERIRERIEHKDFSYENCVIRPTISGGLATFPIDAQTPTHLLKNADKALYRAKAHGKNNVMVYSRDKRRFLRVNFGSPVQVKPLGFDQQTGQWRARGKNISVAGILLESDQFMEPGTKVQLQIALNETEGPLWVIGTVVRVESFESSRHDTGVSFLELDTTAKNEISRYMIRQLEHTA